MDVKLATLIKSLNIMDVIFSGFTVYNENWLLYTSTTVIAGKVAICNELMHKNPHA